MLILLMLCTAVAAIVCGILLKFGAGSARSYGAMAPQRFHAGHIPRLGGVAMLAACCVGWAWIVCAERYFSVANQIRLEFTEALAWYLVAFIAAGAGIAEDLTQEVSPRWRLVLSALAGVVGCWLLGLRVPSLDINLLAPLWNASPWPGIALAAFAVAGLPHAFNLIDGYNGLAGIVALICSLALAYVCLAVGDRQLAGVLVVLAGATAGFLLWNYPRGLIFAGDGGAYLWGVVIAIVSIQLVQRHHHMVSPWFPILLLIYPVWETFFSIYRKLARGQSPGLADALHFHQLIYRRIVRGVFHDDEARRMLMRNNRTSPYLWGFTVLTVLPAVMFWRSTPILMVFTALFVATYVFAYVSIICFKVPHWLRR